MQVVQLDDPPFAAKNPELQFAQSVDAVVAAYMPKAQLEQADADAAEYLPVNTQPR